MKTMNKIALITGAALIALSCSKPTSQDAPTTSTEKYRSGGMSPGSTAMKLSKAEGKTNDQIRNQKRGGLELDDGGSSSAPKKSSSRSGKKSLKSIMLRPFEQAGGRYLEYTVTLSYKTKDLEKSRKVLLDIASKYGFIKSSSANAGSDVPYLSAGMHLKVEQLYDALKELDALGELKSENIRALDHTENMFLRGLQMRREALRLRRKAGFGRIAPTSKNWVQRNRSLEQSENSQDQARFERWKMLDRTSWAKININLRGPELPTTVRVPRYQNAIIGLVNLTLVLAYGLLWISPLLLLLGLGIFIFRKRKTIFRKREG